MSEVKDFIENTENWSVGMEIQRSTDRRECKSREEKEGKVEPVFDFALPSEHLLKIKSESIMLSSF